MHVPCFTPTSIPHPCRQYGAIPVLVKQLRNMDTRAQIAVLGALRNLSFGRTNEANKLEIAGEHGLTEILLALKKSRVSEVRELLTSVLWNLSSSQVGGTAWGWGGGVVLCACSVCHN